MAKSKKHIQNKRTGRWSRATFDDVLPRQAEAIIGVHKGVQYAANFSQGLVFFRRPGTCWTMTNMSIRKAQQLVDRESPPSRFVPRYERVDYSDLIDYETYIAYSL